MSFNPNLDRNNNNVNDFSEVADQYRQMNMQRQEEENMDNQQGLDKEQYHQESKKLI